MHALLSSVMHALSHIEPMSGDATEANRRAGSRTTTPPAASVRPPMWATAIAGAAVDAPVMCVVGAATMRAMHVRLNVSVMAAHSARREKRATLMATGVDTGGS